MHIRAAILATILLAAAPAMAQTEVITDASGDVAFGPEGAPGGIPGLTRLDITGVSVAEQEREFQFTVEVADPPEPALAASNIDLYFTSGAAGFWIQFIAPDDVGGAAAAYRQDDNGWVFLDSLDVSSQGGTWTATVPRILLVSTQGAPPAPGDTLTGFWASARAASASTGGAEVAVRDRAPDTGETGNFAVQLGATSTGGARLFSSAPSRISNGEEATFAYPVTLQNQAEESRDFILEAARVPATWTVDLPISAIHLDAGESFTSYAFVSTPFAHQHGRLESVELALRSVDGEATSKASLYLLYHPIPQPAGHHDTLYLHASTNDQSVVNEQVWNSGGYFAYMNTLEEDEQANGVALGRATSLTGDGYGWEFVLHPVLRTGLDFDLTRTGLLTLQVSSPLPVQDGQINGRLLINGDEPTILADLSSATGLAFSPGAPNDLELAVTPRPESDFVPFNGSLPLVLEIELVTGRPATYLVPESPTINGGSLTLPLFEYRDPLSLADLSLPESGIRVDGTSQKQVKPGGAAVYALNGEADRFELIGTNQGWARLAAKDGQYYVVVGVPGDASPLQIADLVVKGYRGGDLVGLTRILTSVDADGVDESQLAASLTGNTGKNAPGLPVAPFLIVLVAVAIGLRRRR